MGFLTELGAQVGPDLPATEFVELAPGVLTAPIGGIPTILVRQDGGSSPGSFIAVIGSDARTPLVAGNLSSVARGLARRNTAAGASLYPQFDRVSMIFGRPVLSLSPAGFAAAGILLLLAAGYALRRR